MQLFQMFVQQDEAWETVNDIGNLNCVHFVDLNKDKMPHELKFTRQLKILEESSHRLAYEFEYNNPPHQLHPRRMRPPRS